MHQGFRRCTPSGYAEPSSLIATEFCVADLWGPLGGAYRRRARGGGTARLGGRVASRASALGGAKPGGVSEPGGISPGLLWHAMDIEGASGQFACRNTDIPGRVQAGRHFLRLHGMPWILKALMARPLVATQNGLGMPKAGGSTSGFYGMPWILKACVCNLHSLLELLGGV